MFELWNDWDDVPAWPVLLKTREEAESAKGVFLGRFVGQGFYSDAYHNHISIEELEPHILILECAE